MSRGIYFDVKGFEVPLFMEVDLQGFDDPIVGLEKATRLFKQDNLLYAEIAGKPVLMRARVTGFEDPLVAFHDMGLLDKSLDLTAVGSDRLQVGFLPFRRT